jgi:hypothetical protein
MAAMGMRGGKPGVLMFRGWGLEKRIGEEARQQINTIKTDIDAEKKKVQPYYPYAHGVKDLSEIKNLPVSIRGSAENLGEEVPRHFLSVLSDGEPKPFSKGSGRLELAEAILKQPIAMRVIVNRIWRGHFSTGLVDTPSNFGITGERPTNPELLEYLADTFAREGMSIKKLHREIMLSAVYQLSTEDNPTAFAKDSGNRLYWRANKQRMDAEQLRDSVLLVSGNLEKALGGPSEDLTPAYKRRTIYGKVSRYKLDEYLQLFDFPNPNISAERRFTTTVPLQRLFLMNSDFIQLQAEDLAKRVAQEPNTRARIRKAYQIVYGRVPTEEEILLGINYLKSEPMLEYEEQKKKALESEKAPGKNDSQMLSKAAAASSKAPEGDAVPAAEAEATGNEAAPMGMGMMAGMMPGAGAKKGGPPSPKYEPTAWGRYVKVLLSASEFTFIN